MTSKQLEANRIKLLFLILNHRLHMANTYWSIVHVKDIIDILKSGNTIEYYELILKLLENESKKSTEETR